MLGEQHLELLERGADGCSPLFRKRLEQLVCGGQQIAAHGPRPTAPGGRQLEQHGAPIAGIAVSLHQSGIDERRCKAGDDGRGDHQAPCDLGLRLWPHGVDHAQHVVLLVRELAPGAAPSSVGDEVPHHGRHGGDQAGLEAGRLAAPVLRRRPRGTCG